MGEGTFPLGMADIAMRLTEREQDAAAGQVRFVLSDTGKTAI